MHADEPRRIGRRLRQPGDRDRRGVRREHRLRPQHLADLGEDRALDLLALGRGLDHQAAADDMPATCVDRLDPCQHLVARLRVDLFLGDQPVELLGDARLARLGARLVDVASST